MSERARDKGINIDLTPKPWSTEPTTLITELGERIEGVSIVHTPELVKLPGEVEMLSQRLHEVAEDDTKFFNGPLTHVDRVVRQGNNFVLHTRDTTFFDYVAAGYYYGGRQGTQEGNPLTVLATQSVLLTEGERFMFERKSRDATEYPGRYHLFGGSSKPTDISAHATMKRHIENKWGVELSDDQMQVSGLELDNVNNVVHVFFLNSLTEDQSETAFGKYWQRVEDKEGRIRWERGREEVIHRVPLKLENVERLLEHQPIYNWNPPAFDDLLFGLAASGKIDIEELKKIRADNIEQLVTNPYTYSYPYEKYVLK